MKPALRPLPLPALLAAALAFAPAAGAQGDPRAALPERLIALHEEQDDCEPLEDLVHGEDVIVAALWEGAVLYLIPCSGGRLNPSFAAYRDFGEAFVRTLFADYSDELSWTAASQLDNPQWDDATKTLTTFHKGGGSEACGGRGEWRLRDGYLRLEKFYHKQECDGQGEPGAFPLVYEARPLPEH